MEGFEQRILADPVVLGMLYRGSRGRGEADRCADLDLTHWLRDDALAKPGRIEHYLDWLGAIQFVCVAHNEFGPSCNSYIGPDWQRVDLGLLGSYYRTPHPYFHGVAVRKDPHGRLAALVTASGPPTDALSRDAVHSVIAEIIN